MNTNLNPYKVFSNFVLRTPLLPLNFFENLTSGNLVTDQQIKNTLKNPIIREAIFLASPSLYQEALKWVSEDKKNDKLKYTLLKYIARMSSRCTPFGLFAGCALGEISNETEIRLKAPRVNFRHTRLDMNYLVSLSYDIIKNLEIRNQLLFYPNSSIYKLGDKLRYVEYKYIDNKRHHSIVAVDYSEYLQHIISIAKKGVYLKDIINNLVGDGITFKEAKEFTDELVSNQILISELEPSVSGPEFLEQILSILKKLNNTEDLIIFLTEIHNEIVELDKRMGNDPSKYIALSNNLKKNNTPFELKFLFQADMELSFSSNKLGTSTIESVRKGITILNSITTSPKNNTLSKFIDAFYARYGEREIQLAMALDTEIGIGYSQNNGGVNPLVDDIKLPFLEPSNMTSEISTNKFQYLLQKKIIETIKNDDYAVILDDNDFNNFEQEWSDLPDTMFSMIEILHLDCKEKIKLSLASGSSGANLFARFCLGNLAINKYTQSIVDFETTANGEKVIAEIVHLPESRVGNVLMRPTFRKFEIPYLAKSILNEEYQLPLDDLMLSIKNRKIVLRSKRLNKEIIPRLTNAHNFSANSLPIYHLLADMQTQNLRGFVNFDVGFFVNNFEFIPRVEYNNLILKEATWNIQKQDIEPLLKVINNDKVLKSELNLFLSKRNIPNHVLFIDGDNQLLINFNNLTSSRVLLDIARKRNFFKITEFLFDKNSVVKGKEGYYTNQVVLSLYNQNKLNKN